MSSASNRLSRLRRGPIINDVNEDGNVEDGGQNDPKNMVQPMTVLSWHEQRLNKFGTQLNDVVDKLEQNENDVILPLIDTIQELEQKVEALTQSLHLLSVNTKKTEKTEKKKTLKEKANKLKVSSQFENIELLVKDKL